MLEDKDQAYLFLKALQKHLEKVLPRADEMEPAIQRTNQRAKTRQAERHLRLPESAFLNGWVVPALATLIRSWADLDNDAARHALLNEYHRSMLDVSCASPGRTIKHPFTKTMAAAPAAIYSSWTQQEGKKGLTSSWPDFALREPFPHKILFEGKFFRTGSRQYAERELVKDIYQAFFYRGLPFVPANERGRAAWDYDYACLIAYDSSPQGSLMAAWSDISSAVRRGFWQGANIYVMLLGGQGR